MSSGGFQRLPTSLLPRHYSLHLQPDLRELTFTGHVVCRLEVASECSEIVCNSADLVVTSACYHVLETSGDDSSSSGAKDTASATATATLSPPPADSGSWQQLSVQLTAERELLSCQLPQPLAAGQQLLFRTDFTGQLTDRMCGFYRCKYTTPEGEVRYAAATQFEASDARRCFPCWDEPAMKATFDMVLTVPRDRTALSNMPVLSSVDHATDASLHVVTFSTSPIMSTYLVACVVGEFDSIHCTTSDNVAVAVYTPLNKSEQGSFALECCAKILPYYQQYFDIAYPLPKLDLVAIPDFAQGAMENWGLVTFRETCLLVDPVNSTTMRRQWCAQIVGHELAHMWFGNLVTMDWWTDLWLNEGYAEFMMFESTDHLFPEYKIWQQFMSDCYVGALNADALRTSHPIQVPVNDPAEIEEIFDSISYNKGASIIRMLHHYLGRESFRRGIRLYLSRHQLSNSSTEQLWQALAETSQLPVAQVMSTWTLQTGFPVVRVQRQVDGDDLVLQLQQRRYLADSSGGGGGGGDGGGGSGQKSECWMIPVSFGSSQSPGTVSHKHLLTQLIDRVTLPGAARHHWVKLNIDAVGFYRVQYPDEMIEQFKPAIMDRTMPTLDRNALLDDMFALVKSGAVSTVQFLRVALWYRHETDLVVWSTLLASVRRLRALLQTCDEATVRRPFWQLCRHMTSHLFSQLGWHPRPDDDHLTLLLRPMVINHLVDFECDQVLQQAAHMLDQHLQQRDAPVNPDLRAAVYRAGLKCHGRPVFTKLLQLHEEAELGEEKNRVAVALASAPTAEMLSEVLQFALSDRVRAQESVFIMIACGANRLGRELTWQFYRDNFELIRRRYKGRLLAILVKSITEDFCSEARAAEVEHFFRDHPQPSSERSVRQSVETIRLNSAWLQRDQPALVQFLASLPPPDTTQH